MKEYMNTINATPKNTITTAVRRATGQRRGNTLVLVAAVLALLVIIATAYVTRTQSQRQVSVAQQSSAMRGESVDVIAETLADVVADALFVQPVDPSDPAIWDMDNFPTLPADPNYPRKQSNPNASRYGTDVQWLNGDRVTFSYNHAPYHTVPFTNWPAPQTLVYLYGDQGITFNEAVEFLPAGPANPGFIDPGTGEFNAIPGSGNPALAFESNPMGNPGFGDARWLADVEPVRWTLPNGSEAFSHWRQLTNVATANNSWRVIGDISDVERSIITDLTIPIEQWPAANRPNRFVQEQNSTGDTSIEFVNQFPSNGYLRQWANWLGFTYNPATNRFVEPDELPIVQYLTAFGHEQLTTQGLGMPSNFLRLSNLRAFSQSPTGPHKHWWQVNGVFQDRPESEFIPGTARHIVGRVLADTTGDGFTDAFWFDPGLPPQNGVRHIVAVRIEDNSSRLNANVATRFHRNDADHGFDPFGNLDDPMVRTRGHTPVDLALVGELQFADDITGSAPNFDLDHWNVGLLDNPANWRFFFSTGAPMFAPYNANLWERHLYKTGLPIWEGFGGDPSDQYLSVPDRLDYWQRSARHAKSNQYLSPYQPFSLADDLELRMHHGNNTSWVLSDFERTTQTESHTGTEIFRAAMHTRQEQSEYLHQLNNRQLVLDNRRKLTLHSGARNDQLPPWLWWENRYVPGLPLDSITNVCIVLEENPTFEAALPPIVRNLIWSECGPSTDDVARANAAFRRFLSQSRQKLDLREYEDKYYFFENIYERTYHTDDNGNRLNVGRLNLRDRLAPTLMLALTDGPSYLDWDRVYSSYFGDYVVVPEPGEIPGYPVGDTLLTFGEDPADLNDPRYFRNVNGNLNNTRRMAASLAANILAYRSNAPVRLTDRILLPAYGQVESAFGMGGETIAPVFQEGQIEPFMQGGAPPTGDIEIGHIALDYQPFLVEAMIAHVHEAVELDEDYAPAGLAAGDRIWCQPNNATIIMIEIANPFDVPIALGDFRISVFGRPVELGPGTLPPHASQVYYAIPDAGDAPVQLDKEAWEAHFGVDAANPFTVDTFDLDGEWPSTRQEIADAREELIANGFEPDDRVIEIERREDFGGTLDRWYVVDRMDLVAMNDKLLAKQLNQLDGEDDEGNVSWYTNPGRVAESCSPPFSPVLTAIDNDDVTHAMQWVRASRAWQNEPVLDDFDHPDPDEPDQYIPPEERNPRFVFATRQVQIVQRSVMPGQSARRETLTAEHRETGGMFDSHDAALFNESQLASEPEEYEPIVGLFPEPRFASRMKFYESKDETYEDGMQVYDGSGRLHFALRMNLKRLPHDFNFFGDGPEDDANPGFEQIGELLNVWMFGHEIEFDTNFSPDDPDWYAGTRMTFAEFMANAELQGLFDWTEEGPGDITEIANCKRKLIAGELDPPDLYDPETATEEQREAEALRLLCIDWLTDSDAHRTNRLRTRPWEMPVQGEHRTRTISAILNRPKTPTDLLIDGLVEDFSIPGPPGLVDNLWRQYRADPRHGSPALPAGLMVLDAFVADGPGQVWKDQSISPGNPNEWNDFWGNETLSDEDVQRRRLYNANGFAGTLTPGLININTATPEVMQSLPHMARLVHQERNPEFDLWTWHGVPWAIQRYRERLGVPAWNGQPYQALAEAGPAYAHRGHHLRPRITDPGAFPGDPAAHRYGPVFFGAFPNLRVQGFLPGMRGERGMASIGELTLLTQSGNRIGVDGSKSLFEPNHLEDIWRRAYELQSVGDAAFNVRQNAQWRIDYPAMRERDRYLADVLTNRTTSGEDYTLIHPRSYLYPTGDWLGYTGTGDEPPGWMQQGDFPSSARLSTDVQDRTQAALAMFTGDPGAWPETVEDVREANLMFSGISNIVTTRSDVFTIYFRVRSFRQNPSTGVWDATDREHIVDDARYVMLVDRSEVNRPSDKPRILYFERLTN